MHQKKISTRIGRTITNLSMHSSFHLSNSYLTSQHLKAHSFFSSKYQNILTENASLLHKEKANKNFKFLKFSLNINKPSFY